LGGPLSVLPTPARGAGLALGVHFLSVMFEIVVLCDKPAGLEGEAAGPATRRFFARKPNSFTPIITEWDEGEDDGKTPDRVVRALVLRVASRGGRFANAPCSETESAEDEVGRLLIDPRSALNLRFTVVFIVKVEGSETVEPPEQDAGG